MQPGATSFSILERIELSATIEKIDGMVALIIFQYPRTDRTLCNVLTLQKLLSSQRLSVSSNGSNSLQQAALRAGRAHEADFQYPRTDRTLCNPAAASAAVPGEAIFQYPRTDRTLCNQPPNFTMTVITSLSVSSNGSNSLQLFVNETSNANMTHFQYPRTDRTLCNTGEAVANTCQIDSFSILERIELSATAG